MDSTSPAASARAARSKLLLPYFGRTVVSMSRRTGNRERQTQPRQTDITFHVARAVATWPVVKNGEPAADLHHGWQTDALATPVAIAPVQHHSFVGRIPMVQVLRPIDPDRIGELSFDLSAHMENRSQNSEGTIVAGGRIVIAVFSRPGIAIVGADPANIK
jgi:hypothetical protein